MLDTHRLKPVTLLLFVAIIGMLVFLARHGIERKAHAQESGSSTKSETNANNVPATELLRDLRFENGVRPPTNGANLQGPESTCLDRWTTALPSTSASSWKFITIAEKTRFCDNPDTPSVDGDRIVYASTDGSKRFEIDRSSGEVRYVFDTEKEWRNGCNLCMPQDGVEPHYARGAWNWPHLLLSQDIEDPRAPDKKLRLSSYAGATLRFKAELVSSAKGEPKQCPPETWGEQHIPDHCLFYAALVLARLPGGPELGAERIDPNVIYALYPLFYSDSGERYDGPSEPWLGLEPASNAVYFTGDHVRLEAGRPADAVINVRALAEESVAAINKRHGASLSTDEYFVQSILIGWEIWGAYRTDVRLSGLSFKVGAPEAPVANP